MATVGTQKVRCPKCSRKSEPAGNLWRCKSCGMLHDDDPDEGGTHSDRSPSARMEREERNKPPVQRRTSW
jgi:tRNA(Ile2) C34 agmatinyltransferase TiaS